MASMCHPKCVQPFVAEDRADDAGDARAPYDEAETADPDIVVYRITGAFFFGAAASIGAVLERIADTHRVLHAPRHGDAGHSRHCECDLTRALRGARGRDPRLSLRARFCSPYLFLHA